MVAVEASAEATMMETTGAPALNHQEVEEVEAVAASEVMTEEMTGALVHQWVVEEAAADSTMMEMTGDPELLR